MELFAWMKRDAAWWKTQGRVLLGVGKQALIPLALSLIWAVYNTAAATTSTKPWAWNTFIASFGSALAILSILSSQWFRVSKQMRDQDNFGRLNTGVDSLLTLMEALNDRQQPGGNTGVDRRPIIVNRPFQAAEPEEIVPEDAGRPELKAQLQPRRIDDFFSPEDYFDYAHDLLLAGQDYPAAWLAAQGFERAVRDVAAKLDMRTTDSLSSIIRSLPRSLMSGELLDELVLLARVRNNLAHPLKPHAVSFQSEIQLPSRVIQSFEIGARKLRSALR